jgi:hypothetical protein
VCLISSQSTAWKFLEEFNKKLVKEDIFKLTIGNESLHEISNDNGVRIVNLVTPKNQICKKYNVPTSQHS